MDDLESRVRKLEEQFTEFSAELRLALSYIRPDAGSSLTKSRIVLEKLVLRIYKAEMGQEPRRPLLGDVLNDNQFTRKLERRILSRMSSIRDMGNLGPHGENVEPSDAARVLDDLCEVLDWYLRRTGLEQSVPTTDTSPGKRRSVTDDSIIAAETPANRPEPRHEESFKLDPPTSGASRVRQADNPDAERTDVGTVDRSGPPIVFIGKTQGSAKEDPSRVRQAEASRSYMAAKELVYDAVLRRSTDIHLEPTSEQLSVRYRIDGILHVAEPFDRPTGDAVVNVLKVLSALDIADKRKPQDGSFGATLAGRNLAFRVATAGSNAGEKLVMRILDNSSAMTKLEDLGMRPKLIEQVRGLVTQPHGMFLCCGPTGAGKSTTMYAALREIDRYQKNIITIEDPIEHHLENITQMEVNTKAGQTFATSLRSILRQDPDVIMIGEIRDQETASIACQAANTGHMVFSTVHSNDAVTALFRLLDLGVEPFMVASALSGVLGQRLVRLLCEACKEPYKPKPEFLKKANLPADKIDVLYRRPENPEQVCQQCGGTGYFGRTGIYELLVLTEAMRDMIRENPSISKIKAEARKGGLIYLQEDGLRQVIQGRTSIEELLRVV